MLLLLALGGLLRLLLILYVGLLGLVCCLLWLVVWWFACRGLFGLIGFAVFVGGLLYCLVLIGLVVGFVCCFGLCGLGFVLPGGGVGFVVVAFCGLGLVGCDLGDGFAWFCGFGLRLLFVSLDSFLAVWVWFLGCGGFGDVVGWCSFCVVADCWWFDAGCVWWFGFC